MQYRHRSRVQKQFRFLKVRFAPFLHFWTAPLGVRSAGIEKKELYETSDCWQLPSVEFVDAVAMTTFQLQHFS